MKLDFDNKNNFIKSLDNEKINLNDLPKTTKYNILLDSLAYSYENKNNEVAEYLINDCKVTNKSLFWLNDKLNLNLNIIYENHNNDKNKGIIDEGVKNGNN